MPIDQLSMVMLGPGSTVTHAAVKALAGNNCLLAWTGQDDIRLHAASIGGTYSARRPIRQARLASDDARRLEIAWRMYHFRLKEPMPLIVSLEAIRGMEGIRVRRAYAQAASKYDVEWKGRRYDHKNWFRGDTVNRALSAANACLYGVCHAGILSAGYCPALGFIHTGRMLNFVYDIADLYKTELSIPVAFHVAAQNPSDLERAVRMECRQAFHDFRLMERLLPDIAEVLGVSDDAGESAGELGGRIVTLAIRTEDGVFLGNPSARVRDELWLRAVKKAKQSGSILQVWTDKNPPGFSYRQHGERERSFADFEGLYLVTVNRKPEAGTED